MTVEEQIEALYDLAVDNPANEYKRIDVGVVDEKLGELIARLTSIDVTDL